jgi:hypothetical protein
MFVPIRRQPVAIWQRRQCSAAKGAQNQAKNYRCPQMCLASSALRDPAPAEKRCRHIDAIRFNATTAALSVATVLPKPGRRLYTHRAGFAPSVSHDTARFSPVF